MTDNAKSPILSKNVSSSIGLEPPLRFPGFEVEWSGTKLSRLFKKITQKNKSGVITNVICNSAKNGLIPQRDFFDKDIANAENTNGYFIIQKNDFVYNPRKSNDAPYGPISTYKHEEDGIVSPLYLCFRPSRDIDVRYFDAYFKSTIWHRYIYFAGDSGARHDRVSIKDENFFAMPVNIPVLPEQQKIADFLSLVDQRIEKQRQLVEVLKRYKRGLLSLVFKGNFQMVKLADICDFVSSSHTISNLGARESGIYPVYDAAGLSMYIDTYDMHEEYISIVKDGSGIGRLQKCDKNSSFIGTLGALVAKNCEIDYLFAVLQTIDFSRFATGMAIPHIYYKDYKNTLIPLPSQDTQKNISRLFRNIDIHIEQNSIQLDKILVLKHGLLQQMFI